MKSIKFIVFSFFLFLQNSTFAQDEDIMSNCHFDFFGLRSRGLGVYSPNPDAYYKDHQSVELDDKIISIRKFFHNQKIVSEEFNYVDTNTYLFVKYDSINHEVLMRGKLQATSQIERADTFITFTSDTYEENRTFHNYYKWSKEGRWHELYGSGEYKNNIKIGEWLIFSTKNVEAKYVQYDENGKFLSEEPYNMLNTNNLGRVKKEMYRSWNVVEVSEKKIRLTHSTNIENEIYKYGKIIFDKDTIGIINRQRCADHKGRLITTKWNLTNDFIIQTEDKLSFLNNFKIIDLTRYEMILEK